LFLLLLVWPVFSKFLPRKKIDKILIASKSAYILQKPPKKVNEHEA